MHARARVYVLAILLDTHGALLPWQLKIHVDTDFLEFQTLHGVDTLDLGHLPRHLAAFLPEGLHLNILTDLSVNGTGPVIADTAAWNRRGKHVALLVGHISGDDVAVLPGNVPALLTGSLDRDHETHFLRNLDCYLKTTKIVRKYYVRSLGYRKPIQAYISDITRTLYWRPAKMEANLNKPEISK